jgi:hypothetical protein
MLEFAMDVNTIELVVKDFAGAMQQRMLVKAVDGFTGWDDTANEQAVFERMDNNFAELANAGAHTDVKKVCINLANLAMMLWNFERIKYVQEVKEEMDARGDL